MKLYSANVILSDIKKEISRLSSLGLRISFSKINNVFQPFFPDLLELKVHQCRLCYEMKTKLHLLNKCVDNKKKLEETDYLDPFYGSCYAGVEEYIIPITIHKECLMYLEVYGYRDKTEKGKNALSKTKELLKKDFEECQKELLTDVPSIDEILYLTTPISYMIRELFRACRNLPERETYSDKIYRKTIEIMNEHSHEFLSVDEIAKEIGFSPSYIKSVFNKHGTSVAETYRNIRLKLASDLLLVSSYSITEIAMLTGFSDSANFATAFRKKYGKSPREYRKKTV